MNVRVLFFGATADAAGRREADIETTATDAGAAIEEIVAAFPHLAKHKLRFAVNERYVDRSHALSNGDKLAIFTAVSGG
jgi:molybdopterin converting factor small subunit